MNYQQRTNKLEQPRILATKNPKKISQYKAEVSKKLKDPQVQQWKDYLLTEQQHDNLGMKDHNILVQLDATFTTIRLDAAKHLQPKIRQPNTPWSPPLDQAYLEYQYWYTKKGNTLQKEL